METQANIWNSVAAEIHFTLQPDLTLFSQLVSTSGMVLDYGCGYGRMSHNLHALGFRNIMGVDTSAEMIRRAVDTFPHIRFTHVPDCRIPAPADFFDGVLLCAVLTCIPDSKQRRAVLAEISRTLKPGGIAYLVEFHVNNATPYEDDGTFLSKMGVQMIHFTQQELESELSQFNLTHSFVTAATTLSGNETKAIHCIALNGREHR